MTPKTIKQPTKSTKMTQPSQPYTTEFREKAVKLVAELGYSPEQVAQKLGCSADSIRRWHHQKKATCSLIAAASQQLHCCRQFCYKRYIKASDQRERFCNNGEESPKCGQACYA
ncbi:MAG: transposase [Thermoguttaceae bacterium]